MWQSALVNGLGRQEALLLDSHILHSKRNKQSTSDISSPEREREIGSQESWSLLLDARADQGSGLP